MSQVKHTVLPWRAKGHTVYADDEPVADTWEFTGMDAEANARLIVKAVNYHARLVEALRQVTNELQDEINAKYSESDLEQPRNLRARLKDLDAVLSCRALLQELEDE